MAPIDVSEDSGKIPSSNVKSKELGGESDEDSVTVEPTAESEVISFKSESGGLSSGITPDTILAQEKEKFGIAPFSDAPIETIKEEEDAPSLNYFSEYLWQHNSTAPVEEITSHNIDDVIFRRTRSQTHYDSSSSLVSVYA